jgi:hypothetical protein
VIISVAWGSGRDPDFVPGVIQMCQFLGWSSDHPSWFMACSGFETGRTWSPSVKNAAGSGATGLIQFMPSTAQGLGTTIENLELLSATSQLYYVEQYFKPYAKRVGSLNDMYCSILMPRYIGAAGSDVIFAGEGVSYRQNAGLDANHDGEVTVDEACAGPQRLLTEGLLAANAANFSW